MRVRGVNLCKRHRLAGDNQRRRPVVHAGGVPRRHHTVLAERSFQRGKLFKGGFGARMLVHAHFRYGTFFPAICTGIISCARTPFCCARAVRCWLRRANAS